MDTPPTPRLWEEDWQRSLPKLELYSQELREKELEGYPLGGSKLHVLRVNQLDASQLDQEIGMLLSSQFMKVFKFFNPSLVATFKPEIIAGIQLLMYRMSLFVSGATYGQTLQNMVYRNEWACTPTAGAQIIYPLTLWQKLLWGLTTIGGEWAWTRLNRILVSKGWDDPDLDENSTPRRVWKIFRLIDTVYKVTKILNFIVFLTNGRYVSLVDRLLGMRLVYAHSSVARNVNFEFMNRQLVWHGFTEFLLFLMPLIPVEKIKGFISRLIRPRGADGFALIPSDSCPICLCDPISHPYESVQCGHTFCYYCIKTNIMTNYRYTCPRCGITIEKIIQQTHTLNNNNDDDDDEEEEDISI